MKKILSVSAKPGCSLILYKSVKLQTNQLQDTKCLIGYNDDTVVISFRGTASMANVYSDIKVGHVAFFV